MYWLYLQTGVERRAEIVDAPAEVEPDNQPHHHASCLGQDAEEAFLPHDRTDEDYDEDQDEPDYDDFLQREWDQRRYP